MVRALWLALPDRYFATHRQPISGSIEESGANNIY